MLQDRVQRGDGHSQIRLKREKIMLAAANAEE